MKSMQLYFSILMLFALSSCASVKPININDYLGLYQVVMPDCEMAEGLPSTCESVLFFEIIKGQFIGIKNTELAYVFWSGYPKIDPELQYTSHAISNQGSKKISNNIFWLNRKGENQEYLTFSNGKLERYYLRYKASDTSKDKIIQYKLKSVRRGGLSFVRMNYPGNN